MMRPVPCLARRLGTEGSNGSVPRRQFATTHAENSDVVPFASVDVAVIVLPATRPVTGAANITLPVPSVATDGTGNVMFAAPVTGLVAGNTITATSTDANGTTSEFSACVVAN